MKELKKPKKLRPGDKVATVSLSWGGAGDEEIEWRYLQAKERLQKVFGLQVVEMEHTLAGSQFIYEHPEKRAEDLMKAFADPEIKAILCCIGGIESIRMHPYIDYEIIANNPKIFMGYSDTTTTHLMCFKAGVSSFYGPALLVDFAENVSMDQYTVEYIQKTLFEAAPVGNIPAAPNWTSEHLPWLIENKQTSRQRKPNAGYELLQGEGKVRGRLLGGCLEVFDSLKGTELFPTDEDFDASILFLETSEDKPPVWYVEMALRSYGINGLLNRVKGMIFGKPYDEKYYKEYNNTIRKVLAEFHLENLPVLVNMSFGHTEPKFCLPYGAIAELDCEKKSFAILEAAVLE